MDMDMRDSDFFKEIAHIEIPWGERRIHFPVFYYDMRVFGAYLLARTERVKAILPSSRMNPYRVTPWHCIVSVTAYQYRDCDLGPYNELAISVPITLDKATALFTGLIRSTPPMPMTCILHLPVTTEIACAAGVEWAGYPKFLAQIDFYEEGEWLNCRLKEEGRHILTLSGRKLPLQHVSRQRVQPITNRKGRLLRCEFVLSEREAGQSSAGSDVRLELGDHAIAQELGSLGLGRVAGYEYCPHLQAILTPVLESLPA